MSKAIHDLCQSRGIPVWCGGMLESGVGRAHNVALASLPNFMLPGDLSPSSRYWERDIVRPEWTMDAEGMVHVPLDRPGIGVDVDMDRVDNLTVRREDLGHALVDRMTTRPRSANRRTVHRLGRRAAAWAAPVDSRQSGAVVPGDGDGRPPDGGASRARHRRHSENWKDRHRGARARTSVWRAGRCGPRGHRRAAHSGSDRTCPSRRPFPA